MTIQLARALPRKGYRYQINGEISKNSVWSQTLKFPSDGDTLDLSDLDILIAFNGCDEYGTTWYAQPTAWVLLSVTGGQIAVQSADTITIAAVSGELTGLSQANYCVDIASKDGSGNVTHLATGLVTVRDAPSVSGPNVFTSLPSPEQTSIQHNITVPGDVVIADGDIYDIHKISNTSGSPVNVYLPDVTIRLFPITIADVAGNAATYNITILPKSGSGQTIMTGSQYVIDSNGASFTGTPDADNGNWI